MMSRWNYVDMLPLKCEFCKKDFKQMKRESEFYLKYDHLILIMCPYCDKHIIIKWVNFVSGKKWKSMPKP